MRYLKQLSITLFIFSIGHTLWGQDASILLTQAQDLVSQFTAKSGSEGSSANATKSGNMIQIKSPFSYRFFEAIVDTGSLEYQRHELKIICPYTGKSFFIGPETNKEEQTLTSQKVRSPFTGQYFTAQLNMEGLLTGDINETILVCPYTGKTFRFSMQEISNEEGETLNKDGFQMVLDPESNKFFKVYSNNGQFPVSAQSPYTGQKVMLHQTSDTQIKFSAIETSINKIISLHQPMSPLRQFGYDLFALKTTAFDENAKHSPLTNQTGGQNNSFLNLLPQHSSKNSGTGLERSTFEPISSTPISKDYLIGPGDEFIINIWGKAQQEISAVVSRDGKILLPEIGPIYVWGKTLSDAEHLIKDNFERHYSNIQINITMGRLRTIRVFVLGDTPSPGGYILSSRATVLNALFQANGPTHNGSLRNITIKRGSGEVITLDLYQLLLSGDKNNDIRLESNDVVFINTIGPIVAIAGAVQKPAIYEINDRTNIKELIKMAGGFSHIANKSYVQILRTHNQKNPHVEEIPYADFENTSIKPGDILIINSISSTPSNIITLKGHVSKPGDYAYKPNMRLKDILEKSGPLLSDTFLKRVEIIRKTNQNIDTLIALDLSKNMDQKMEQFILKNKDTIQLYAAKDVSRKIEIEIRGDVLNPGTYPYYKNMRINDLIFNAGGLKEDAQVSTAEVFTRQGHKHGRIHTIPLSNINQNASNENNPILSANDLLVIRSQKNSIGQKSVFITGEVKSPGEFIILPGDTISSIIKRSGGFTDKAFLNGSKFLRESVKTQQLKFANKAILKEQELMLKEEATLIKGSSQGDLSASKRSSLLSNRKELLEMLSKGKVEGRMLLNISSLDTFEGSDQDIELQNGDRLHIPPIPDTVQVLGSVYNNAAILYEYNRGPLFYIEKVGGFTRGADRKKIYIIRANGEVDSNFSKVKKIRRGDTIVVPESFKYKTPRGVLVKDTVEILYRLALGAAVVSNLD